MNAILTDHPAFRAEALRLQGERVTRERVLDVFDPYTRARVGTVPLASVDDVRTCVRRVRRRGMSIQSSSLPSCHCLGCGP